MTLVSFHLCFLLVGWTCTQCWLEHYLLPWSHSAWELYTRKWWTKKWTLFPPSSLQVIRGMCWDLFRSSRSEPLHWILDCESCCRHGMLIVKNTLFFILTSKRSAGVAVVELLLLWLLYVSWRTAKLCWIWEEQICENLWNCFCRVVGQFCTFRRF